MIQSKSCMKFAYRVKEIDRCYEVNNNAELDNGVYHEFNKEEKEAEAQLEKEDSLLSEFTESEARGGAGQAGKQTELQLLERMMKVEAKMRVGAAGGADAMQTGAGAYGDEARAQTTDR